MCDLEANGRVSAYHDGEMTPDERRAFEEHLARCAECGRALEELRRLSGVLAAFQTPPLTPDAMTRLRRTATAATERTVVRLAERLMAAAAAVLIVSMGWALAGPGRTPRITATAAWEWAAVSPGMATTSEPQQIAQWIVNDLSLENGHE
jgi:anti-sigma factor RsiW